MINNDACSGCSACKYTCPVNAIEIVSDKLTDFKFAEINTNACIKCNKCESVCPHINFANTNKEEAQEKYALKASTDILSVSTSGGAFSVLAKYYSNQGYLIVGVKWDKDFRPMYSIARTQEEWYEFRGSKYMQPDVKSVFLEIRNLLNNGEKILFTGVPCHVSGLLNFLGKKYDNLVTIDLFCGALSSPLIWEAWYKYQDIDLTNVKSINMRAKKNQGNKSYLISIEENDGQIHNIPYATSIAQSIIGKRNYSLPICHDCKYRSLDRVSDYTIADLWNSKNECPELHDNLHSQVSTFLCNSIEAKTVVKNLQEDTTIKIQKINSIKAPKNFDKKDTQKIFKHLQQYGIVKPKKNTTERPYDIAVCGGTFNNNFGATLTYYALYRYLELCGYKTIILPPGPNNFKGGMEKNNIFDKYCNIAPNYFTTNITSFNSLSNTFILGSDQMWNHSNALGKMGSRAYLDYISDSKTKIAYAVSYGGNGILENTALYSNQYKRIKRLVKEFDYISTREEEGINITKEIFDRDDVVHTIDPIFLIDNSEYDKLINDSLIDLPQTKYGCYYILSPYQKSIDFFKEINKLNNKTDILIGDGQIPNVKKYKENFPKESFVNPILAQDWLKYIKNAEYVITSSFHCCCFCVLFNIPFLCVRGENTLSNIIIKWLLKHINQEYRYMCNKKLDINKAQEILHIYPNATNSFNDFIDFSKNWLNKCLPESKTYNVNTISPTVAACVISKNEEDNIIEWIEHYKKLGFNKIIFFDNNENLSQYNLLLQYIKDGYVIYNDFTNKRGDTVQREAYSNCVKKYFKMFDWVFFVDMDEFLLLKNTKTIQQFILSNPKFKTFDGICINWFYTTDKNILINDKRLYTNIHNQENKTIIGKPSKGHKALINTQLANSPKPLSVHSFFANTENLCDCNGIHTDNFTSIQNIYADTTAVLLHGKFNNITNTVNRINRGDCNGRSYNIFDFEKKLQTEIYLFFKVNEITKEKLNILYEAFPDYIDLINDLIRTKFPTYNLE